MKVVGGAQYVRIPFFHFHHSSSAMAYAVKRRSEGGRDPVGYTGAPLSVRSSTVHGTFWVSTPTLPTNDTKIQQVGCTA